MLLYADESVQCDSSRNDRDRQPYLYTIRIFNMYNDLTVAPTVHRRTPLNTMLIYVEPPMEFMLNIREYVINERMNL